MSQKQSFSQKQDFRRARSSFFKTNLKANFGFFTRSDKIMVSRTHLIRDFTAEFVECLEGDAFRKRHASNASRLSASDVLETSGKQILRHLECTSSLLHESINMFTHYIIVSKCFSSTRQTVPESTFRSQCHPPQPPLGSASQHQLRDPCT